MAYLGFHKGGQIFPIPSLPLPSPPFPSKKEARNQEIEINWRQINLSPHFHPLQQFVERGELI